MKKNIVTRLTGVVAGCFLWLATMAAANTDVAANESQAKAYWQAIVANEYRVPDKSNAMELMRTLVTFSSSPDPELRDTIGYETFWRWVHLSGSFSAHELDEVRASLVKNVRVGLGEQDTDSVFGRSFAMLLLKELAAKDLKTPFLTDETFAELLLLSSESLAQERDLRGYVAMKGWAHATAHAADLLRALARNPRLRREQILIIANAVVERARASRTVWSWGEDARLGAVLATLASRPDVPITFFEGWTSVLLAENKALWLGPFDAANYRRVQAQSSLVTQMAALLTSRPVTPTTTAVSKLLAKTIVSLQ